MERKYWFKTTTNNGHENCIEPCHVKNNGIMIGSAKCQECEHCKGCGGHGVEFGFGPDWIQCSKLEEARGVVKNFAHTPNKEPQTEALNKHNVMGRSELLPLEFVTYATGTTDNIVRQVYAEWLKKRQ